MILMSLATTLYYEWQNLVIILGLIIPSYYCRFRLATVRIVDPLPHIQT